MLKGIGASLGIAIGHALVLKETSGELTRRIIDDVNLEIKRFEDVLAEAEKELEELRDMTEEKFGEEEAEIFSAHIMMLQDPELIETVKTMIESQKVSAEFALNATVEMFADIFKSMDDEYMRERGADIKDVGGRVVRLLLGIENNSIKNIDSECILIAKDLTPSDTAQIDKTKVLGFATEIGGRTSHSAIMARTLDIPAIVGATNILERIKTGDLVILDGIKGEIIHKPDDETLAHYNRLKDKIAEDKKVLQKLKNLESKTTDGRKVELAGNIGGASGDVENVLNNGGEGIGLFRTEFLYMESSSLPTEEEQFLAYKNVLEGMKGKPVVIRTLDIGGDKKLPYLKIDEEMNPFLGYRAIRLCLDRIDIFKTQLRALFRASIFGTLKIMFPMISSLQELRAAKKIMNEVKEELVKEGIEFSDQVEIGIMIEIPSAAIISDVLAKEVDFFSIGTNDLIQYTLAVDRMNEKISNLYDPFHPGVLRLIKLIIDNAHKASIWVGMCGEMAGDIKAIPILLGLGLDEFSMSPSSILKARKLITSLSFEEAKNHAEKVLELSTSEEINEYLEENINY